MVLNQTILKENHNNIFTKEEYLNIYNQIIKSLASESDLYFTETTNLLLQIIDNVDKTDMDAPSLYKALIKIFETLQFSASYLKILRTYLSIHIDFKEFINESNLSLKKFFELLPEHEDIIYDILSTICRTDNVFEFINANISKDQLLDLAFVYIKHTKEIKTMRMMEMFRHFTEELINSDSQNAFAFKFAVSLLIMPLFNDTRSEFHTTAVHMMKLLTH